MNQPRLGARRGTSLVARSAVVAALTVVFAFLGWAPANAHATLLSTTPAEGEVVETTPDVVTFEFTEPVKLSDGSIQTFDATGKPVESDASASDATVTVDLPDELDDGTYVIAWRVVSEDGHPIGGSLTFSIGEASETVAAPNTGSADDPGHKRVVSLFTAIGYVALLLAGGLIAFASLILGGVRPTEAAAARLKAVTWAASGIAFLTFGFLIPLSGAYRQGLGLSGVGEEAAVQFDLIEWDLACFGLIGVGLLVGLLARPTWARAVGAVVAVAAPSLVGHTRAYPPEVLMISTDVLHLLAGAIWLGGLVGLVITLPGLASRQGDAATTLSRFSTTGAGLLAVLVSAGTLMSWRILGSWDALWNTTYGRLLLIKIAIVALAVALAAWNRFGLLPRVLASVGHQERVRHVDRVRRTVLVEGLVLVGVLAITGFLVNQSPETDTATPAAKPVPVGYEQAGDYAVLATLTPGKRGANTVQIQVQDINQEPVDLFASLEIRVSSDNVDLGTLPAVPVAAGTYEAEAVLPTAGEWNVQVSVPITKFDNPVVGFDFTIG